MRHAILVLAAVLMPLGRSRGADRSEPPPAGSVVTIVRTADGFRLQRGGKPYSIQGACAFHWPAKQETTATWHGMTLASGETLGCFDTLRFAWTGTWPANRAPTIASLAFTTAGDAFAPGEPRQAQVVAADAERDPLTIRWELLAESRDRKEGGDREKAPGLLEVPDVRRRPRRLAPGPRRARRVPAVRDRLRRQGPRGDGQPAVPGEEVTLARPGRFSARHGFSR